MSFQGSINQVLGSASEVASEVSEAQQVKAKELAKGMKAKTQTFKNFDKVSATRAKATLQNELAGKKAQDTRIKTRIETVRKKRMLRDTGPVVPMNID